MEPHNKRKCWGMYAMPVCSLIYLYSLIMINTWNDLQYQNVQIS